MEILGAGTVIGGKYVITELLGSGGMGHVYHARHYRIPEFEVAIKSLDPAFTTTVENKDRFRNEVLAGYRANHPNIIQMYEYFDLGAQQAFAMEYVNAGTLHDVMDEGPLPLDVALNFVRQIALGLSALHRAGTYHRDLKPANVLVTEEGVVKLTDFGVARVRGGTRFDEEGLLAGTPKYVPPEYVETGESDHRGDIYALGVLAYEMVSGASPFRSDTNSSLLKEHLEVRGHDLCARAPDTPDEVGRLVERCMATNVIQRFPHAIDVAEAVAGIEHVYGWLTSENSATQKPATRIVWSEFLREAQMEQDLENEGDKA
jgi:serine/threonine protein kinase